MDCDQNVIHISQADIPFTITEPGRYCVIEDLFVGPGQTAITIDFDAITSNITVIDLNNYSINGLVSGQPAGANGILGIATTPPPGQPLGVGIQIINGKILGMVEHGIYIPFGLSVSLIDHITIQSCGFSGGPDNGGIVIGNIDQPLISPVISNTFVLGFSFDYGIILINPLNYLIINTTTSIVGQDGINIQGQNFAVAGVFSTCTSSGNAGNGFITTVNDSNVAFSGCIAASNGADGFDVAGSQSNFTNCRSKANTGHGFTISSNNNIFDACFAIGNTGSGFAITGGFNNDIQQCVALNNTQDGFLIETAPNELNNNTASGNGGLGFNATVLGNRIYTNYSSNNGTNFSGTITNVAVSPVPADPINHTTNISN